MEQELSVRVAQFVPIARETKKKSFNSSFLFHFKLPLLEKVIFVKGISHFQTHGARIVCQEGTICHTARQTKMMRDFQKKKHFKSTFLIFFQTTSSRKGVICKRHLPTFKFMEQELSVRKAQFVHAVSESQTDKDSGDSLIKKNSCLSLFSIMKCPYLSLVV